MASYTLRQLKYFVTTVEAGSVAEASRQLIALAHDGAVTGEPVGTDVLWRKA